MPPAVRSFTAIIAGMVCAITLVTLLDLGAARLHPTPPGFDARDMAAVAAHAAAAPTSALLAVLAGWILGPFVGGVVATRIADRQRAMYAWVIASLFLAATAMNLYAIPHPAWMVAGALLGVPMAGWFAARLAPPDAPR